MHCVKLEETALERLSVDEKYIIHLDKYTGHTSFKEFITEKPEIYFIKCFDVSKYATCKYRAICLLILTCYIF